MGAADAESDAAAALLPQPDVRRGERRFTPDVLRDVRLDLPAGAVLPDRAGLLAASRPRSTSAPPSSHWAPWLRSGSLANGGKRRLRRRWKRPRPCSATRNRPGGTAFGPRGREPPRRGRSPPP